MAGQYCSSQQLWVLFNKIGESLSRYDDKAVLELHRNMILRNVNFFESRKEPVDDGKKKLKNENVIDEVVNYIDDLSSALNLDLLQTHDLLFSFLLREYSGGNRNINNLITEEKSKNSLTFAVEQFYFQEQIYIIKCLTKLVKIYLSTSSQQPLWEAKLSEKIYCIQFFVSILRDFTTVYEKMNFTTILEKQGRAKCRRLILHYFSMQEEILKMLIWSFHIFEFSVESAVAVLDQLKLLSFCQKYFAQKVLTVEEIERLTDRLESLKFLFVTKIFDLELLFYTYQKNFEEDDQMTECKSLWLTNKNALRFEEAISNFAKVFGERFSGGFYLSWTLNMQIRKSLNENLSDENFDTKLMKCCILAKQNNGFESCLRCLTSSCISSDKELHELASAIVYLIVDGCFSLFEPESLGGIEFISMFQQFSCYCERFTTFDQSEFILSGENLYESVKDRRPYSSDAFIIPSGSLGHLVETDGDYFEIRWRVGVNCWQILLTELSIESSESVMKKRFVIELVDAILNVDPTLATQLVHFLNEAVETLKTSSLQSSEDIQILSSCLSCLTRASVAYPKEVLNMLITTNLFPSAELKNLSLPNSNQSLIAKIINDFETVLGNYSFCVTFLELVFNLLNDESFLDDVNLSACVAFILTQVFPFYQSWSYSEEKVKDIIGCLSLKIFQKTIENVAIKQKLNPPDVRLHKVSKFTIDSLMFGEARHNLMKIASVGPDVLRGLLRILDSEEDAFRAFEMVAISISLIVQLLDVANAYGKQWLATMDSKGLPPLFTSFCDKKENFVSVLGKYLMLSTYEPLPRLALLCLEKTAGTFPSSLLSSLGETAEGFCDIFLNRLESPLEDWQLKLSCVKFLTVCVQKQPGLAEKLTCSSKSDNNATNVNDSGLKLIFEILRQNNVQPDLFVACIGLFTALWRCKWTESTKTLKKLPNFWQVLTSPLTGSEEDFYLKISTEVFELLTLDIYYFGDHFTTASTTVIADDREDHLWKIVEKLLKSDRIELTFIKLKDYFESGCELNEKLKTFKRWSNFMNVALIRGQVLFDETIVFDLIQRSSTLQLDLLKIKDDGIWSLIRSTGLFYERYIKFASTNYVTSNCWTGVAENFGRIIELLTETLFDNHLASISIAPLYASLVILSEEKRKFVEKREFIQSIFNSLCLILNKLIIQWMHPNDSKSKKIVHRSMLLTIGCICAAVRRTEPSIWLTHFKKHCLLHNLVSVMSSGLILPTDACLFASITNLFSAAAQYEEALCTLHVSGFCDFICSKLPSFYSVSLLNDENVFGSLLTFYTLGLVKLEHQFVDDASVFVSSWEEVFSFVVNITFEQPSEQNLKSLKQICIFFRTFSRYKERWVCKAVRLLDVISDLISKASMRLISYLSKPTLIKDLPSKKTFEDEVFNSQSHRANVQQKFFETLLICSQILLEFSPNLESIPSDYTFDPDAYTPLCALDFSTNLNPDVESRLTFGGLLLSCILSVNCLKKMDGTKSTSPSVHRSPTIITAPLLSQIERNTLTCLMESTIYLCISQGFVQLNHLRALDGQQALIKRELGTELDLILSKCGRSTSSPSTPRKSPAVFPSPVGGGGAATRFDQEFVKLAREFVRVLFKS